MSDPLDTVRIEIELPRWCAEALSRWNPAECGESVAERAAYIVKDHTERFIDDELAALAMRLIGGQVH